MRSRRSCALPAVAGWARWLLLAALAASAGARRSKRKGGRRPAALGRDHEQGAQLLAERRLPEALVSFDRAVALGGLVPKETREQRSRTLGIMGRSQQQQPSSCFSASWATGREPRQLPRVLGRHRSPARALGRGEARRGSAEEVVTRPTPRRRCSTRSFSGRYSG